MTRPPHIAIRADAFAELGGGHIMRCLSLAHWLAAQDCRIAFACAPGSAGLVPALARSGFAVLDAHGADDLPLPDGWPARADAVFVDLYSSVRADETRLRARVDGIAVIEDLDDRPHDCDLLVDPGAGRSADLYAGRVPANCRVMAGPGNALLRDEFAARRAESLARRTPAGPPRRVLVSMGLTDVGGISQAVTRIVLDTLLEAEVDVVLGPHAASRAGLEALAAEHDRLHVRVDIDDMAAHMAAADIAIGAGGGTALERCVLGLPSIAVVLADNQRPATRHLAATGALYAIDDAARLDRELPPLLTRFTPQAMTDMSQAGAAVCDGRGAERVGRALLDLVAARNIPAGSHV